MAGNAVCFPCLTHASNKVPVFGPSMNSDEVMPESCSPRAKMVVIHWPCEAARHEESVRTGAPSWYWRGLVHEDLRFGIELKLTVDHASRALSTSAILLLYMAGRFVRVVAREEAP